LNAAQADRNGYHAEIEANAEDLAILAKESAEGCRINQEQGNTGQEDDAKAVKNILYGGPCAHDLFA
jgi:hypothetical protein